MKIKGYTSIKEAFVEEIQAKCTYLKHTKTGAKVLLIENEDENKVFSISFRTTPKDDTGVPHILEHSVLCGSEKYPVKDPFVELLKGSLNTFLNAMTFPDKTMYPVASCNEKDFKNLVDIYLDAVFHPNIYREKKIFEQEGWHYELESPEGPLTINGVVYNEMKGALSSPDSVLMEKIMQTLYPSTTYGVESGGDPEFIPNLSYEQFLKFHESLYSPSNSYIVLYGNMDSREYLKYIDKEYLSHYKRRRVDSKVTLQRPFTKIKKKTFYYPISADESMSHKDYLSYSAVVGTSLDVKLCLSFEILTYVLLGMPDAPLKRAILDAGLGDDVQANFEDDILQPLFSITVSQAESKNVDQFVDLIRKTLEKLVKEGIDKKAIASAINYYEFQYRELDAGRGPRGLNYAIQVMSTWLYDDKAPFDSLLTKDIFAELKQNMDNGYFEKLVQKYLLDNKHAAIITLVPSKKLASKREKLLVNRLEALRSSLSEENLQQIVDETKALKAYQAKPNSKKDLECIPSLTREDIRRETRPFINEEETIDSTRVVFHPIETNGIGYLTLAFQAHDVPERLIPYMGVLTSIFGNVDTKKHSYGDLSTEILANSGGITYSFSSSSMKNRKNLPLFFVRGKAFYEKLPFLFDTISEILNESKLDDAKRLQEIVLERKISLQSAIQYRGDVYGGQRALSYLSEPNFYNDLASGLGAFLFIQDCANDFDIKVRNFVQSLKELMTLLFRKENLIVSYTGSKESFDEVRQRIPLLANSLTTESAVKHPFVFHVNKKNEGFKCSSPVQYVTKVGNFKDHGFGFTGALRVLKSIIDYEYLWIQVRVKGGAYGVGMRVDMNGDVMFSSYRDPKLHETFAVFEDTVSFISEMQYDEQELTKFIIGTIGSMDYPLSPSQKGETDFIRLLTGYTQMDMQKMRDEVLEVNLAKLKLLKPIIQNVLSDQAVCVIGNEKLIFDYKKYFNKTINLFK